jgi:hypothetical protein
VEVEFELTPDDFAAFQRYHKERGPKLGRGYAIYFVLLVAVVGMYVVINYFPNLSPYLAGGVVGIAVGFFAAVASAIQLRSTAAKRVRKELAGGKGWRRLLLTPDGVTQYAPQAAGTTYWHAVLSVGATRGHAFLYIKPHEAYVVPARAFHDDREFEDFVELARRYREDAKDGPPPARLPDLGEAWRERAPSGVQAPSPPADARPGDDAIRP